MKIVLDNTHNPWNLVGLSQNPEIQINDLVQFGMSVYDDDPEWVMECVSQSCNLCSIL
jgi:hypothetical protein